MRQQQSLSPDVVLVLAPHVQLIAHTSVFTPVSKKGSDALKP